MLDPVEALVAPQVAASSQESVKTKALTEKRMVVRRETARSYFVWPRSGHLFVVDPCGCRQESTALQ